MCLIDIMIFCVVALVVIVIYVALGINGLAWIFWVVIAAIVGIFILIVKLDNERQKKEARLQISDVTYLGAQSVVTKRGGLRGAIVGDWLFGDIGALLGSAVPLEEKIQHRFIVRYENGEVKTIECFDGTELYEKLIKIAIWGEGVASEPEDDAEVSCEAEITQAAEDWLEYEPKSRQGLIEALEYDGYAKEQATSAVDNYKVDWNEQAVRAAKEWLEFEPLSRKQLIEYLIDDGFTHEQAEYAANTIER